MTDRHELARRGQCPDCGDEYDRLAGHWRGSCSPPALDRRQRTLVAGLCLGNGHVGGNGANNHFQVPTRWRPFARWVYAELEWLALRMVRVDDARDGRSPPAQRYIVRTHAHPDLARFRSWYRSPDADGDASADGGGEVENPDTTAKRLPAPADLPGGALTSRAGRAWHATAGSLAWSDPEYATTRQAAFSAESDARAERVMALLESVGLDPTRAGKRVQLPPKQTTAWLDWIGGPVPGVAYKWAADCEEYREAKRDAEALRARSWYEAVSEPSGAGPRGP